MELDLIFALILILIGFGFGLVSIMIGIGGGLLYVTFLIFGIGLFPEYSTGLEPAIAGLVSSFVIVFTASSGFYKHMKLGRIDFKTGTSLLLMAVPGSIIGSVVAVVVDGVIIKLFFAFFIGGVSVYKIYTVMRTSEEELQHSHTLSGNNCEIREITDSDGIVHKYDVHIAKSRPIAFIGGFIAGLLGIGGGVIYTPLMIMMVGLPIHLAIATASYMIIIVSLISIVTKTIAIGNIGGIDYSLFVNIGIPMATGAMIGARIGAAKMKKVKAKTLQLGFWIIALASAVRMGI